MIQRLPGSRNGSAATGPDFFSKNPADKKKINEKNALKNSPVFERGIRIVRTPRERSGVTTDGPRDKCAGSRDVPRPPCSSGFSSGRTADGVRKLPTYLALWSGTKFYLTNRDELLFYLNFFSVKSYHSFGSFLRLARDYVVWHSLCTSFKYIKYQFTRFKQHTKPNR